MNNDIKDLLTGLEHTPNEVARLIADLPLQSITLKPSPDEFSALENVCHLRDIEIEGYAIRIQRILTENHPLLADVDGARLAVERDYNTQNLSEALSKFKDARRRNLTILKEHEDQFERDGVLEGVGEITLGKLLEMMYEHDQSHLDDLRRSFRTMTLSQGKF